MTGAPVKVDPRPDSGGDALYPVVGPDGVARYADGTRWEPSAAFPGKGRWVPDLPTERATSGAPPWVQVAAALVAIVGVVWLVERARA